MDKHDILTLAMYLAIYLFAVFAILMALVLFAGISIKKRFRRIEKAVNGSFSSRDFDLLKPRENLTKDEISQIRTFLDNKNGASL